MAQTLSTAAADVETERYVEHLKTLELVRLFALRFSLISMIATPVAPPAWPLQLELVMAEIYRRPEGQELLRRRRLWRLRAQQSDPRPVRRWRMTESVDGDPWPVQQRITPACSSAVAFLIFTSFAEGRMARGHRVVLTPEA